MRFGIRLELVACHHVPNGPKYCVNDRRVILETVLSNGFAYLKRVEQSGEEQKDLDRYQKQDGTESMKNILCCQLEICQDIS